MESTSEPIAQPTIWYRVARLLPIAVAGSSVLALPEELGATGSAAPNYIGLAVSVLGIVGAALYYFRKRGQQSIEPALTIFWVWALLQLPSILLTRQVGDEPIWHASQLLNLSFHMVFKTDAGNLLRLGLNLLPVLFFAWIRRLRIAENFGE